MLFVALLTLCSPLAACGETASQQLTLTSVNLDLPSPATSAPIIGPLPAATPMQVGISFKISQTGQDTNPIDSSEPNSITGLDEATYQAAIAYFQHARVKVKSGYLRTYLGLEAKASTFEQVFHTHLVLHKLLGRTFYAPTTPPQLPEFIAQPLLTITGLDNYSSGLKPAGLHLHPLMQHTRTRPAADCSPPTQTQQTGQLLLPRQVAHAYGYDQLWNQSLAGQNVTVNLVEIDGINQADIQNYFSCINFKGSLKIIDVPPQPTPPAPQGEATLDIEMVAGLARSVNIVDYETATNGQNDFTRLNDILQTIINNTQSASTANNGGNVVSISLGASEDTVTSGDLQAIDQSLQTLSQEHIPVFVSSGDTGAYNYPTTNAPSVSFPASDPSVVAVGGTTLAVDANCNRVTETAWAGSGGGTSAVFTRPTWQQATGMPSTTTSGTPTPTVTGNPTVTATGTPATNASAHRQVPDVAAVAWNLVSYYKQSWQVVGGTSAAAPIWAAGTALLMDGLQQQQAQGSPTASPPVAQGSPTPAPTATPPTAQGSPTTTSPIVQCPSTATPPTATPPTAQGSPTTTPIATSPIGQNSPMASSTAISFPQQLYAIQQTSSNTQQTANAQAASPFFDITQPAPSDQIPILQKTIPHANQIPFNPLPVAPGWDQATGLGTPNIVTIMQALSAGAASSTPTASPIASPVNTPSPVTSPDPVPTTTPAPATTPATT